MLYFHVLVFYTAHIKPQMFLLVWQGSRVFQCHRCFQSSARKEREQIWVRQSSELPAQGALRAHPVLKQGTWASCPAGQLPQSFTAFPHDGEPAFPKTARWPGEPFSVVTNFILYTKEQLLHFNIHGIFCIFWGGLAPIQMRLTFLQDKIPKKSDFKSLLPSNRVCIWC